MCIQHRNRKLGKIRDTSCTVEKEGLLSSLLDTPRNLKGTSWSHHQQMWNLDCTKYIWLEFQHKSCMMESTFSTYQFPSHRNSRWSSLSCQGILCTLWMYIAMRPCFPIERAIRELLWCKVTDRTSLYCQWPVGSWDPDPLERPHSLQRWGQATHLMELSTHKWSCRPRWCHSWWRRAKPRFQLFD